MLDLNRAAYEKTNYRYQSYSDYAVPFDLDGTKTLYIESGETRELQAGRNVTKGWTVFVHGQLIDFRA